MLPHCTIPAHVMALYVFAVISLTLLLNLSQVEANVIAVTRTTSHNRTLWEAPDKQALFGPRIPEGGIWGHLIYTKNNGCQAMDPIPKSNSSEKWIAMVKRGGCPFDHKVHNAELAGYVAAIVHNVNSDDLERMGPSSHHVEITIPSVFIGEHDAREFQRFMNSLKYTLWINSQTTFNYWPLMKDFIIIACGAFAFGLLIGLAVLVVRWIRDIRRRNRSRLSLSHLKKIPVKKFKKGDQYDMCAICLDDYDEGDKLRILPCSHAYHQKCIDPWLTKNKKFCPICKRKVLPGDDDSDSEEDSDEEAGQSENTPLLGATVRNDSPSRSRGGTFDNSGLPSNMRNHIHQLSYDEDDTSSDEDYSISTSNYQSSVEVHQGSKLPETLVTLADETTSTGSGETESADSEAGDVAPHSALEGASDPSFDVVDNHFAADQVGCINGDADNASRSSSEGYVPLVEENLVVTAPHPRVDSPVQRDQIV